MLILSLAELDTILTTLQICPPYSLRIPHNYYKKACITALLLINTHLHYSTILMFTPTTNSSRIELGESVIFQPILQAYPSQHSWIIRGHVLLGNLECHWRTFNSSIVPLEPSNIKDIYNSGKTTITSAIKLLQSNQPRTHICCRRSLLPFLRDAFSWLTGTATTKDIHTIKTRINQLIATRASQHKLLVHIVSILNNTRYTTQVNRCGSNALMDAVRATSHDTNNLYNLTTSLATSINFHQLILHIR